MTGKPYSDTKIVPLAEVGYKQFGCEILAVLLA